MIDKEFDRLLKITRLKLTEAEREKIIKDVDDVLQYFDRINSIETSEEPAYQPIKVPTRFRKDEVKEFKNRKGLLQGTKTYETYILGPKL